MTRQMVINDVYAKFCNAGDDKENAFARLELLNVGTDELEVADAEYEKLNPTPDHD